MMKNRQKQLSKPLAKIKLEDSEIFSEKSSHLVINYNPLQLEGPLSVDDKLDKKSESELPDDISER